jgi:hypothetical protein
MYSLGVDAGSDDIIFEILRPCSLYRSYSSGIIRRPVVLAVTYGQQGSRKEQFLALMPLVILKMLHGSISFF